MLLPDGSEFRPMGRRFDFLVILMYNFDVQVALATGTAA